MYKRQWIILLLLPVVLGCASCQWHEAKEVIAMADSIDQTQHVIYDDTAALGGVIRTLDNPLGKLLMSNTLGKAYYYMGRNHHLSNRISEAAECYIEADRLKINDPIYRGRVNSCMGYICTQDKSNSLAAVFYDRAAIYFEGSNNEWYYAQSLLNRTEQYAILNSYVIADSLLQIAQTYQLDSAYQARYYETKGLYYYALQQYDSALMYFKKTINIYQADPSFTYLKILQTYHKMNQLDSAVSYAEYIINHSNNSNYRLNAYFILINKATQENQVDLVAKYSAARQDTHRILDSLIESYALGTQKISEYLSNPHPWRWVWYSLIGLVFICLLSMAALMGYRRRTKNAYIQLDALSIHLKEQENVVLELKHIHDYDKLATKIRTRYPNPLNKWNEYSQLQRDLYPYLQNLLNALDKLDLTNREKVFSVLCFIYPQLSTNELAKYLFISKDAAHVRRARIAKKLGISSSELLDVLKRLANDDY